MLPEFSKVEQKHRSKINVEKRQVEEALYDKIAHTDASQFFSMAAFCQPPKKKGAVPSSSVYHADSEEKRRVETAALKIQ